LTFSDAALGSAPTQRQTIDADLATQLVVTTQPPTSITAGQAFSLSVSAQDQFKNVNVTYGGSVTIRLAGDPSFTTTVPANGGVATFTGLTVTEAASGQSITASADGLSGTATNPLGVTSRVPAAPPPSNSSPTSTPPPPPSASAPAPTVLLERLATIQKTNKKGKPVGKPVFSGFSIEYSEPMNSATAGLAADYRVFSNVVKKVKKQKMATHQPVPFSVSYNPALSAVTLQLKSAKQFALGGEITISGVTSQGGVALNSSDTTFTILVKAKGITLG
jgi:hypothetical protein